MAGIKFVVDSSSDITVEQAKRYDIDIIPMQITFGKECYRDLFDIDAKTFYEKQRQTDQLPQTAQPAYEDFFESFKTAALAGKQVICVTISSKGSGTYNVANLAMNALKEEMEADIDIIDSSTYSVIFGQPVIEGAIMAQEGKSKEEIKAHILFRVTHYEIFIVAETLKYLKKGGRIHPAVALIGEALDIKPILSVKEGVVAGVEKIRGIKRASARALQLAKESGFCPGGELYLLTADATQSKIDEITALIEKELGPFAIHRIQLGPTIGVHTGPELWGLMYFHQK